MFAACILNLIIVWNCTVSLLYTAKLGELWSKTFSSCFWVLLVPVGSRDRQ